MKAQENTSSLRQLSKIIGEVSGYVAAVIGYITLVTGNLPGRFSKTAAVLGVIFTFILLCIWRWSRITQQRTRKQQKTQAGPSTKQTSSMVAQLTAPFRSSDKDKYSMPLAQRRMEGLTLLLLGVFTIGWSGSAVPEIAREFNPPPFALEPPCDVNSEAKALRVVIADFDETSSNEILFEERLYDEMSSRAGGDMQVCRMRQVIKNAPEVQALQEEIGSTVFIWGRSDKDAVDAYLEVNGWGILTEHNWSFENDSEEFQARELEHLIFLTQYSFSWIRYVNGQYSEARRALEIASEDAKEKAWAKVDDNNTDLADAYFLLGLISEDDDSLPQLESLRLAKVRYDQALDLQPDMDRAILNRGRVCMVLDEVECAMRDFTELIERDSSLAVDAYINRAALQPTQELIEQDLSSAIALDPAQGHSARGEARLSWGDLEGALSDFEMARELTPEDPYVYHNLGVVQLLSGDFQAAIQTYKDCLPYLDDETRSYFIEDLNYLEPPAGAGPSFQETVRQIETVLEEARLP